ncbi:MAG: hypothetical protein K0R61_4947, partial [Microvirga sp.]|nr:hypothetical protein [Microvirga sp.]
AENDFFSAPLDREISVGRERKWSSLNVLAWRASGSLPVSTDCQPGGKGQYAEEDRPEDDQQNGHDRTQRPPLEANQ